MSYERPVENTQLVEKSPEETDKTERILLFYAKFMPKTESTICTNTGVSHYWRQESSLHGLAATGF